MAVNFLGGGWRAGHMSWGDMPITGDSDAFSLVCLGQLLKEEDHQRASLV